MYPSKTEVEGLTEITAMPPLPCWYSQASGSLRCCAPASPTTARSHCLSKVQMTMEDVRVAGGTSAGSCAKSVEAAQTVEPVGHIHHNICKRKPRVKNNVWQYKWASRSWWCDLGKPCHTPEINFKWIHIILSSYRRVRETKLICSTSYNTGKLLHEISKANFSKKKLGNFGDSMWPICGFKRSGKRALASTGLTP